MGFWRAPDRIPPSSPDYRDRLEQVERQRERDRKLREQQQKEQREQKERERRAEERRKEREARREGEASSLSNGSDGSHSKSVKPSIPRCYCHVVPRGGGGRRFNCVCHLSNSAIPPWDT